MNFGNIEGLVNGTEQVVASYIVIGSAVTSIDLGSVFNGDEDGWYTVIVRHVYDTSTSTLNLYFNTDNTAANYGYRGISANNTTVANISSTSALIRLCSVASGTTTGFSVLRMYAKQGAVRLCNSTNVCDINGTTVTQLEIIGSVWNNTNTNLTNMVLAPSAGKIGLGAEVYVLKSNNFTNGTPTGVITTPYIKGAWVRVKSQVLGAPASSVTFSGLDGDRDVMYAYRGMIKCSGALLPRITFNQDTTANHYGLQLLYAGSTAVSAYREATTAYIYGSNSTNSNGTYAMFSGLIFAKSGFVRTVIQEEANTISGTTVGNAGTSGNVWVNTADNLIRIDITASGNNFDTGSQYDLYALRPNG